jgi:hypothetical protein
VAVGTVAIAPVIFKIVDTPYQQGRPSQW